MRKEMLMLELLFSLMIQTAFAAEDVRTVSATSCDKIRVNLGLGMTTQIVFEREPQVTLFADKNHYQIKSNKEAPRSLAVIPVVSSNELDSFRNSQGQLPSPKALASSLDKSFMTNLFVFFKNNNQMMFELRFVQKDKADYVLKVDQDFTKDCTL